MLRAFFCYYIVVTSKGSMNYQMDKTRINVMKTLGIVAEYNPFHKGHEYMLRKLKKRTGSDYVVAVMSGDFVQRGAPSVADKFTRTKMALLSGADLVLELPVYYSTGSAEYFAGGALSILSGIGCVDFLGFGSESDDLETMLKLADLLAEEPAQYRDMLRSGLKEGLGFAAARARAIETISCYSPVILSSSNDILGVEYLKALKLQNSNITPVCIKRQGAGYHDSILTSKNKAASLQTDKNGEDPVSVFASAEEIRGIIERCFCEKDFCKKTSASEGSSLNILSTLLPDESLRMLKEHVNINSASSCNTAAFNRSDNLSSLLYYKLLSEKNAEFEKYLDVSGDLSDKIVKSLKDFTSFSDFIMKLKSKDLTYTHISRALIHILLNITAKNMNLYSPDRRYFTSYARILGLNKNASPLLKRMQENSKIPVISRLSDAGKVLSEKEMALLSETITASEIYDMSLGKASISEYSKKLVSINRQ